MELKVLCGCGQKYKFDVEPVNGLMPFVVNCPSCGIDGTTHANSLIAQLPPPSMAAMPAALVETPPPIPAPPRAGLQINRAAHAAPAAPVAQAAPPPIPTSQRPVPAHAPAAIPKYMQTNEAIQNNNFAMGILGAFLGAALGVGLLYGFYLMTDLKFPLIGTISGALTGFGARLLYRGTSSTLGAMAAAIAFVAIGATLFMMFGILGIMFSLISLFVATSLAFKIASG